MTDARLPAGGIRTAFAATATAPLRAAARRALAAHRGIPTAAHRIRPYAGPLAQIAWRADEHAGR